jgi:hypothetical protein
MKNIYLKMLIAIIIMTQVSIAQNSVVVINNPDNLSFTIYRDNRPIKKNYSQFSLRINDIIICKELKKLSFNWAPYASGQSINDSTMKVTITPPLKTKNSIARIIDSITSYLGFCEADSKSVDLAVRNETVDLPGTNVSGIQGFPISFSYLKTSMLSIYDSLGNKIISKELIYSVDKNVFSELPSKLNLESNKKYNWSIINDQSEKKGTIRMVDPTINKNILKDFKTIDKQSANETEGLLKKASYLQMLSEINQDNYDYYWLSYYFLGLIKNPDYPDVEKLLDRYYKHSSQN